MMDIHSDSGTYSKTDAYNFLKELLDIPKKAMIPRKFFNLFFLEYDDIYLIKKPEEIIRGIFKKERIRELNDDYYREKKENNTAEAGKIAKRVLERVAISLTAA